jgi:hypothetical protein
MLAARRRWFLSAGAALAVLAAAGAAQAAKCSTCSTTAAPTTTTTTTDASCGCTTTTTTGGVGGGGGHGHGHGEGGGWGNGGGSGVGSSSSGSESASSAYAAGTATSTAYATVFATSLTSTTSLANIATSTTSSTGTSSSGTVYNGGGGGSFYVEQGANGSIPNLQVEGVEARQVCAEFQSAVKMVAIEASCLDDKDVPHPASQVLPDRDVIGSYEGEVYRCIAGARMQYTIGSFAGAASFDHGQTITCAKNMALYHSASGELVCRVQKQARDCNERSLLRRYGAGIKVLKIATAQQCVSYRSEQVAGQSTPSNMAMDGGVGGVVH